MVKLDIRNQLRISYIDKLVEYLSREGSDLPTISIEKEDNDLAVMVNWTDNNGWKDPKDYYLYYKVEGVKDLIGSFLGDYAKTADLHNKLGDYTKIADLHNKLGDYTKIADLHNKLGDYTKIADLHNKLGDYTKIADLHNKLGDYTKIADLHNKLGDYTKIADLHNKLGDYTKIADLNTKLSDYTRTDGSNMTDDISNKLMSHCTTQVLDFLSSLETEYNAMHG